MRKLYLLILFSVFCLSGIGQNQTLTLTFLGEDANTYIPLPLEQVYVQNVTRGCDTILLGDSPSLVVEVPLGIWDQPGQGPGSFTVFPPVPNPFSGTTSVEVQMNQGGLLYLSLLDAQGRIVSEYKNGLPSGKHRFEIKSSVNSLLLLKVSNESMVRTIKLLNTSDGSIENSITYKGTELHSTKSALFKPVFTYHFGDQLFFKSIKKGYYDKIIVDSPISNSLYTFDLIPKSLPPTILTDSVSMIGISSVVSGGNIISDGGSSVVARGVCWSLLTNPTIAGSHTSNGSGGGAFVSEVTGLTSGTNYYLRAYATNSAGTAYGDLLAFTTLDFPVVSTSAISGITQSTANCGGQVISDGGSPVTARGVCWDTIPNPTTAGNHTSDSVGLGFFTSKLTGLTGGTLYYTRAYATTIGGTSYGDDISFTTHSLPAVTPAVITDITQTSANSISVVLFDGGVPVTARGVCWSISPAPTIAGNHTTDGSGVGAFVSHLSGLTGYTLYYIRSYATNIYGTAYGDEQSFTTLTLPDVTTTGATNITQYSATSGGNVLFEGGTDVIARGICWSTSPNPAISGSHTTDGAGPGIFVSNLTGLTWGMQYYIRAYATNSVGTAYGLQQTFMTLSLATVNTTAPTNITQTTATSGGDVISSGGGPVTARGVCWSTMPHPSTGNNHTINGSGMGQFTSNLTGLTEGTIYYIRAYATNMFGTAYGDEQTFTTLSLPTVVTTPVTNITQTTASSGGNVTSEGGTLVTARGVCWSTAQHPTTSGNHTTDGTGPGSFISDVTGLTGGMIYYIRAYAVNVVGTAYGNELTFTTLNTPSVTTTAPSGITTSTAISGGNVSSAGGAPVTVRGVCWSTSANPTTLDNHTLDGAGTGTFTSTITGLTASASYFVRAYASNSIGTAYGNEFTFTTINFPVVTTTPLTNISMATATSGGNVLTDGGSPVTARGVCWSTTSNPSSTGSHTTDGTGTGSFVSNITGLTGSTVYYLRAYATNSVGTVYGAELTFTTLNLPVVTTTSITNVTQSTASSGGNVTSDGGSPVTLRGVCWSTSHNPIATGSHTSDGSGTGTFVSNITGLSGSTVYYVRAYATNGVGTAYGGEQTCTTLNLPAITTTAVTGITQTTALSGGTITSDGGSPVTVRGVCWSTLSGPTITNPHTNDGSGTGTFTSTITGLTGATQYYVRAYATSSLGTGYGNELTFTSLYLPTVTTAPVTNIGQTVATSGGEVTSDGGDPVSARGVCWSTLPNPTTGNSHTSDGTGIGPFISNLTGLTGGTVYYIRAYATNSVGTAYGPGLTFTTLNTPTVSTSAVTIITQTTATTGGNVTADGGSPVTGRGVCWSTTPNPTIANNHTLDGTGIGIFVSYVTGLTGGTLYYVRAYATNSVGTSYGAMLSFTTFNVPTVTTSPITGITQLTAATGGNVTSSGGPPVTSRGVCWSISTNPTTSDSHTFDGSGTGIFISSITGLNANTIYYVRAYAINSIGTAYGNEISFTTLFPTCPGTATVTYEGTTYNTLQVGTQCWFKENLNVGTRINGVSEQTDNGIKEKYCYNDLESNCNIYGGLYQWSEAMQYVTTEGAQGLCPAGWHIPTQAEFNQLTTFLGGSGLAGGALKETGTSHWAPPNAGATNSSGFTGLPGGMRNFASGTFGDLSLSGNFISSSSYNSGGFDYWEMFHLWNYDPTFQGSYTNLGYGVSLRCIKN